LPRLSARRGKQLEEVLSTYDIDKKLLSRVHAFPAPPAGFDPRKASNKMLEKYGFPHRPDPKALPIANAIWNRVLSRPLKIVKPTFKIVNLPGRVRPPRRRRKEIDMTSGNWSGAVNVPPTGTRFMSISASWIVQSVTVPPTGAVAPPTVYTASAWVGIDDSDILQAGTAWQVDVGDDGVPQPSYWAWFEWFPAGVMQLTSIPIAPGDEINVAVLGGDTTGVVSFANLTSGIATVFTFDPPTGTSLIGNYAEWIIERYEGNLADFGAVFFHDAIAIVARGGGSTLQKTEIQPSAATSEAWTMVDAVGNTATPLFGDGFIEIYYGAQTPPPQAEPPTSPDLLISGQGLLRGQSLTSSDGRFTLILQNDGNLVIYDPSNQPLWASNTWGHPEAAEAIMQNDGNFVVYDVAARALWSTNTSGNPGAWVIMQSDGNLVLYDSNGQPLWASNTAQA
jgi:hypothetical protein